MVGSPGVFENATSLSCRSEIHTSRQTRMGRIDLCCQQLAFGGREMSRGGTQQQCSAVVPAEHAGKKLKTFGRRDLVRNVSALRYSNAPAVKRVRSPDLPFCVERTTVACESYLWKYFGKGAEVWFGSELGPNTAIRQLAIAIAK